MKRVVLSVGCFVSSVVVLAGCGVSVKDMPVDERLRLDADSSEFRSLMEAFPAHVEELRNNPDGLTADETDYFMDHFGVPDHRASEEFRAAAREIISSLDYVPNAEKFAGVLLLIREDGYEEARTWFDNYESNSEVVKRLSEVLEDAKGIAVKSSYYETREQLTGGDSDALAEKFREYALAELTEFEMPLTEEARENLVLAGMNERSPAVLTHLQAGLPPAGMPLTNPATREIREADPLMMEAFTDRARSVRTAEGMGDLIEFTRENIPQAAPAAPLAVAAFLDRSLAPDAFAMFADLEENHPDAIQASADWIDQNSDVSFARAWEALRAYSDDDANGGSVVAWLQEETAEFAETDEAKTVATYFENDEENYAESTLGKLTAVIAAVDTEMGPTLEQAAMDATPAPDLANLVLLHLILDHLTQDRPQRAAEIINKKLAAAANLDGPAYLSVSEVTELQSAEEVVFLTNTLTDAMVDFAGGEYNTDIAAVYLTLLASQRDLMRETALSHAQTYFDGESFVEGLFGYMVRKGQFGLAELARYEVAVKSFDSPEVPLVENLDAAIESSDGPENVYWALKVLSLDVLEDIGTETAVPVLEKLAQDTSSYELVNMEVDPATGEETVLSEEEIRVADRANEILENIGS